jgi:hypothetical protein
MREAGSLTREGRKKGGRGERKRGREERQRGWATSRMRTSRIPAMLFLESLLKMTMSSILFKNSGG